jgi:hypothetical protein
MSILSIILSICLCVVLISFIIFFFVKAVSSSRASKEVDSWRNLAICSLFFLALVIFIMIYLEI